MTAFEIGQYQIRLQLHSSLVSHSRRLVLSALHAVIDNRLLTTGNDKSVTSCGKNPVLTSLIKVTTCANVILLMG